MIQLDAGSKVKCYYVFLVYYKSFTIFYKIVLWNQTGAVN